MVCDVQAIDAVWERVRDLKDGDVKNANQGEIELRSRLDKQEGYTQQLMKAVNLAEGGVG